MSLISKFLTDNSGATSMEYATAAALISIVSIVAFSDIGAEVGKLFVEVDGAVTEVSSD